MTILKLMIAVSPLLEDFQQLRVHVNTIHFVYKGYCCQSTAPIQSKVVAATTSSTGSMLSAMTITWSKNNKIFHSRVEKSIPMTQFKIFSEYPKINNMIFLMKNVSVMMMKVLVMRKVTVMMKAPVFILPKKRLKMSTYLYYCFIINNNYP